MNSFIYGVYVVKQIPFGSHTNKTKYKDSTREKEKNSKKVHKQNNNDNNNKNNNNKKKK